MLNLHLLVTVSGMPRSVRHGPRNWEFTDGNRIYNKVILLYCMNCNRCHHTHEAHRGSKDAASLIRVGSCSVPLCKCSQYVDPINPIDEELL